MTMGVTLERVQFKFASIIGELCSEPDILSQFAVWVDLRLAEYKLKGSISLDCSGDTPDPIWLKGIVNALLKRQLAKQKRSVQSYLPLRPSSTHTRSPASPAVIAVNERLRGPVIASPHNHSDAQLMEVRLSPDIVIKEEPSDDGIYPIRLHVHEHDSKEGRKRTAAETITSKIDLGSHSQQQHSPKLRRLDLNLTDDIQTSNESLMSIIGLGDHSQDASAISATEVAQYANEEMDLMGGNSSMQLTPQRASGTAGASASNLAEKLIRDRSTWSLAIWDVDSRQTVTPLPPGMKLRTWRGTSRRGKRLYRTLSHLKKFESWISSPPYHDLRKMEEIPAEELDTYLAIFFSTVKKDDGREYVYNSLATLWLWLEKHLREQGYPHLIRSSKKFLKSQMAVQMRRYLQ